MSEQEKKLFSPDELQDHGRPLGRFLAESIGAPFAPIRSLDEPRAVPDGVVILQGDEGGQVYVVCPASEIACSAETLAVLLQDLDEIAWPGNAPDMRRVSYERLPPGASVAGGMGGGQVAAAPWIHEAFVRLALAHRITDVLAGRRPRIA